MNKEILRFREQMKATLDPPRFEHSLSVSFTCMALAMHCEASLEKAEVAGILHDCAKCYDDYKLIELCKDKGILLTEDELLAPAVIHAKYGAWMAEHEFGITDSEILSAIRWHTTGRANMALLEKILYIADYIEPRRDKAANLDKVRKLAFESLDETIYEILASSLEYLNSKGKYIDNRSKEAYNYYSDYRK